MAACFAAALMAFGQARWPNRPEDAPKRLPDGRHQSELIIREDYKQNLADLERLQKLVESIREDLEKSQGHVLSLKSLKDLEEIEKLTRRIRSRMKKG